MHRVFGGKVGVKRSVNGNVCELRLETLMVKKILM